MTGTGEGTLIKISHDLLSSQKQSQFFIFSDILLWTTQNHKYRGHMELTTAGIKLWCDPPAPAPKTPKTKFGFQISVLVAGSATAGGTGDTPNKKKQKEETFICGDEKGWI